MPKDIKGDTMEIIATFQPDNARCFGLKVRVSSDGKVNVPVWYDTQKGEFGVADKCYSSDLKPNQLVTMQVFVDRSVIEVYVNGNAITKVAYLDPDSQGIEIFSEDGDCMLESIDVWQMESMSTTACLKAAACSC